MTAARRPLTGIGAAVELVRDQEDPGRERVDLVFGADRVAIGEISSWPDGTWVRIQTDQRLRRPGLSEAWHEVAAVLSGDRGSVLNIVAWDGLVRQALRRHGFGGPLGGVLVRGGPFLFPAGPVGDGDGLERLVSWIAGLSDVDVRLARKGGLVTRLTRRAAKGVDGMQPLDIYPGAEPAGGRPLRLWVPLRGDLLVEEVASGVAELARLSRRFPGMIPPVSLDLSNCGLAGGHLAGQYGQGVISVNARYVLSDVPSDEVLRYQRPFIETVTLRLVLAHEVWHAVELVKNARQPRVMSELDQAMGAVMGVGSLARAFLQETEADVGALRRVEHELGPYAATLPGEATAELFAAAWASPDPPPLALAFLGLVDRYLPAAK